MSKIPGIPGQIGAPLPKKWSTSAFAKRDVPLARGTAIERSLNPREMANKTLPQRFKSCGMIKVGVVK
jgi:hypothetical protein